MTSVLLYVLHLKTTMIGFSRKLFIVENSKAAVMVCCRPKTTCYSGGCLKLRADLRQPILLQGIGYQMNGLNVSPNTKQQDF